MEQQNSVRLQKYIAERGVASRRAAEEMIAAGRVRVNGKVVTEMGLKIDPIHDRIKLDGDLIGSRQPFRYILLNKPAGYICSTNDERGRRTVLDLLHSVNERVYPVGRLDYDTSGLLLLTNDGDLAHHLLHPSHQVDKTYLAQVETCPNAGTLEHLRRGVRLSDGLTAPAKVNIIRRQEGNVLVEIAIHEGRNHQIKRMMEAVGYPVMRLKRTQLAFLDIRSLKPGEWRELSLGEVTRLKQL